MANRTRPTYWSLTPGVASAVITGRRVKRDSNRLVNDP